LAAAFKDAAFVLAGFSLGGYVLFRYVARFGCGIARLMLLGTGAEADTSEGRARRAAVIERIAAEGEAGFLDEFLTLILSPRTLESRPAVAAELRGILRAASARRTQRDGRTRRRTREVPKATRAFADPRTGREEMWR
jgi:pimeloyl-ACP methyl ester carboxylesterase